MDRLQSVEFEILKAFVSVCEKLNIDYYLVCGSALGAVKYGGFIPWDDDVDVALRREDYETFCEKAPQYLPDRYFVQNYKTDPKFPPAYTKIRDVRTTFVEKGSEELDIVHGVYIDVFPLDGHPEGGIKAAFFEAKKRIYVWGISSQFRHDSAWKDVVFTPLRAFSKLFRGCSFAKRYDKAAKSCPLERSSLWCNYGNSKLRVEYAPREQYKDGADAVFEGLSVKVPSDYDAYLTQKYGDWRADLPDDMKVGHHNCVVCDLDRPYGAYAVKTKKGAVRYSAKAVAKEK